MSHDIDVRRGARSPIVLFAGNDRDATLLFSRGNLDPFRQDLMDFPDKATLTFPKLYHEILVSHPGQFSFDMTQREVQWHRWLLENRSMITINIDLCEYDWRPDRDGLLVRSPSLCWFEWAGADSSAEGRFLFKTADISDDAWIRHLCTSLRVEGDPIPFDGLSDDQLDALVTISPE